MSDLILTRGLPGSGKTTWARNWVRDGDGTAIPRVRVSRDDIREQHFGRTGLLTWPEEETITAAQTALVETYLDSGFDVVIDDCNLRVRYLKKWADLAMRKGATVRVAEFPTPVNECIQRDMNRGDRGERYVGEDVIRRMYVKYIKDGKFQPFDPSEYTTRTFEKYIPDANLPSAYIFDIDGTLAHMNGRSPYDYSEVYTDSCDVEVRQVLWHLQNEGHKILIVTGRNDDCQDITEKWLQDKGIRDYEMFMRVTGDRRDDAIVKDEIFTGEIQPKWYVHGVFDDRDRVVRMWRAKGLKCFQVQEGNF